MSRLLMKIAYDGTEFYGWQIQKHSRTVQYVLQKALLDFSGDKIKVTGSGRTDTGVHALGQYAHFDYTGNANTEQLRKGLKRFLPEDIQILKIFKVSSDFHARYDAFERCYKYIIANNPTPFNRLYQASFPRKRIQFDILNAASQYFIGKHDFSSFSKDNPAVPDHVCTIKESGFELINDTIVYTIRADRFLHNMVRRIIGLMINISHMELEPDLVLTLLKQKQAKQTLVFPVPPQGLYLTEVLYPKDKFDIDC